ncbi:DNA topoisomerase IV subunit A [Candidatus Endowatersipora endosymbiont of Watersipora subatra]|uniref:DNA topoisomerase IV subunit A n=1 Tax=Candidatus Endowatersipora endosymbiont of Watersipora subatra TaxID=3077946 RepID=UPI003C7EAE9D
MKSNLISYSESGDSSDLFGVEPVDLRIFLEDRYLSYALSTIMGRALPDVRDGMKPVHRRILHAMHLLRLLPESSFAKCARIVGDTMGKFHPHGDQAIYDTLVRLSQSFTARYPLIDGQGNFGNLDGDNAAAMRYTEARMTHVAIALLDGIAEDTVDFRPTYNEEDEEPVVFPAAFPNLLANGTAGIAVGMATSIPPHNAAELCDVALHLIKFPNARFEELFEFLPGPDFPTGGIIVESHDSILESYRTGKGGFRTRAVWRKEDIGRGIWQIVITEIPYQVQKSKLIEKIAELLVAKRVPLLADIRDESDEEIRIILEPKSRFADPNILMEHLFKLTDLESRFPLNMNVLSKGKVPRVMNLYEILKEWLDHRKEVLIRRSRYRLSQIEKRLEILGARLVIFLNIDEVISIICHEDNSKQILIERFEINENQAESILNSRLSSLHKLEKIKISDEFKNLKKEKGEVESFLKSPERQWERISWEVEQIKKKFSKDTDLGARRSNFMKETKIDSVIAQDLILQKEPITVVLSEKGWIRALKGHLDNFNGLIFKEGDSLKTAFHAQTTDRILLFTTGGKFYTLIGDKLPTGRGHGEPIRTMFDIDNDSDFISVFSHVPGHKLLVASTVGNGFLVQESDVLANTRKGKQILNVSMPVKAVICKSIDMASKHDHDKDGPDSVAIVGENRKLLIFSLNQIPEMRRGKGVRLQKYRNGGIKDIEIFSMINGLTWIDSAGRTHTRYKSELMTYCGERAQIGRLVPKGFPRNGKFR